MNENDSHYRPVLRKTARCLVSVFVVAGALAACSPAGDSTTDDTLDVVATTTILGDIVSNVVGDMANVIVLMPVGADPHDFQASSRQVAQINEADLVVANGLGLEEGLVDVLSAAMSGGVVVLEVATIVEPLLYDEGAEDPHFWMDPVRVEAAAMTIASTLNMVQQDPRWAETASRYGTDVLQAHAEIEQLLAVISPNNRKLVTNHDSLRYFADRYGFEILGVVVPGGSTLSDPSSEDLANLVRLIEDEQVSALFAETTDSSALAAAVAAEAGREVRVVELYTGSLGAPSSPADTLIGMLRVDAERIADALGE
jgi:zinc/manganese transport system substrate-binding protein